MLSENTKGHLAAIIGNVIFGLNISVVRSLFTGSWITIPGFAISRVIICLAVYWLIGLFRPREKILPMDMVIILIAGFFGIFVPLIMFPAAIRLITPVTVSLISALLPIAVLLLSAILLKEKLSVKKTIGVILGISGAFLVVINAKSGFQSQGSILGIFFAVINILCVAAYYVMLRKTSESYSTAVMMKWIYLMSIILITPYGSSDLPQQRVFSQDVTILPMLQFGFTLLLTNILGMFLIPVALNRIKPTTVSIYNNLQPLVASAVAIIIGQDVFTWDKPLALVLIVSGVFIVTQTKSRKPGVKEVV